MSIHDELERDHRVANPPARVEAALRQREPSKTLPTPGDRPHRRPMSAQSFLALQRCAGNHAVVSVMRDEDEESAESSQESSVDESGPISADVESAGESAGESGSSDSGSSGAGSSGAGSSDSGSTDTGSGGDQDGGVSGSIEEQSTSGSTGGQSGTTPDGSGAAADTYVLTEEFVPTPELGAPDTAAGRARSGFSDGGMVGVTPFRERTDQEDMRVPHVFTDGGMTGTVPWAGGGGAGARGNQNTGSLQTQVVPVFTASPGPTAGRFSSRITPGTGLVAVTRSFLGAFAGGQGNGQWVSNLAVQRINQHERNHVASTRGLYAAHLAPLEARIANAALGVDAGATEADAVAAHQAAIKWVPTINTFSTADTAANKAPNGTVDTADVAAGWLQDLGPGNVLGTPFTNRIVRTGDAAPPSAAPAPPAGP